jgi:hypothetical protein
MKYVYVIEDDMENMRRCKGENVEKGKEKKYRKLKVKNEDEKGIK